jgi:hypothetical protein
MNKFFLIVLILISISCDKSKQSKIAKVIVYKVNLNIDTAVEVNCAEFQSTFDKKIECYLIDNYEILNKLELLLKERKISKKHISLDVRKKIVIYYRNKSKDSLCLDRFNVMVNSQLIEKNNDLLNFLLDL